MDFTFGPRDDSAKQQAPDTDEPFYGPMIVEGHQLEAEYSDEELWGD